jgi:low affinity Fe/Cu permease
VDSFAHIINSLLQLLVRLGDIIVGGIVTLELWMRGQLSQFGLTPQVQTVIMVAIAVVLILGSLKLFGGLIRVAAVLVLILIALHIVMPVLQH